ncbi:hypothetical protein [Salinarimonas soli]|nr:hypothetical protein [Salinarimonas soli]
MNPRPGGEFVVRSERGRRAPRVHMTGGDVAAGLARPDASIRRALA